jgi:hypothetical protein
VYASPWSSPSTTQHSLPGGRYPFPGPDFHRLDRASFAWRTATVFTGAFPKFFYRIFAVQVLAGISREGSCWAASSADA